MDPIAVNVTSSVTFVSDLERSVSFYRDLFGCDVAIRENEAALLVTPGGFQIYLRAMGHAATHPLGGIGVQYVLWATNSQDDLDLFWAALGECQSQVQRHVINGVSFAEGRDPDGIPLIIAFPAPQDLPRQALDSRFYSW